MSLKKSKILIVEDNKTNRLTLVSLLEDLYILEQCTNGQEAIELTKTFLPDLILMDIEMPIMNGFDACELLQADPEYKKIPIIFITGQDNAAYEATALNIGAIDYITKPMNGHVALSRIKIQLDLFHAREERDTKIDELEKMIRIFELKFSNQQTRFSKTEHKIEKNKLLEELDEYVFHEHGDELEDLESEMDATINRMFLEKNIDNVFLFNLAKSLNAYAKILRFYPVFHTLGMALHDLSNILRNNKSDLTIEYIDTVLTYFESLFFTLTHWRVQIINKELENPNMYDASMLSDINMISLTFQGKLDTLQSDIEFF